jgi:hypothetical protein
MTIVKRDRTLGPANKARRLLPYRRRSGIEFSDPMAKLIYSRHMTVMAEAKHYFYLLYGSHDFLVEVLDIFMTAPDLGRVASALHAYEDGKGRDALNDVDPHLAILVLEPDKKRSDAFVSCKTNLLFSVIASLRCWRHLMRDDLPAAIFEYGQSAYYLGGCIGVGVVLFGDESLSAVARRGADKRHEGTRAARAWVTEEWARHREAYGNNKSAFARDYVGRLRHEHSVTVTEKQLREVWLRGSLSGGEDDV